MARVAIPTGGRRLPVGGHLCRLVHVIDDDTAFRTAMERRLKHAGYEVATYALATHLLDRLPSDSVLGCILLDVRMPGMSGPALQSAPKRSRLDIANYIRYWPCGHSGHGGNHQGGCG